MAAVLLGTVLASSAGAYRGFSRNQQEPWFRDNAVCTDGIQFNLLVSESGADPDPGDAPANNLSSPERLQVTTDIPARNPATFNEVAPSAVLATSYSLPPIANDDPSFDGATFTLSTSTSPRAQVSTDFLWWGVNTQEAWSTTLAPGTQLYVFLADSDDNTGEVEIVTVSDCTLFDDPTPPPTGNPCDHPDAIHGTDGNDKIKGTNGDDIICAGDGNDRIFSYGGNDIIYAGDGNDKVHAGSGDDTVFGEGGNDNILGQWGNDTLDGGEGNDKLHGSGGDDVLIGGPGNDKLVGGRGHDTLTQ